MVETPTPVRQLVARFDKLHVSSAEKGLSGKENRLLNSPDNMEVCKSSECFRFNFEKIWPSLALLKKA